MSLARRLTPNSMVGQMMAVLAVSFTVLLAIMTLIELSDHGGVAAWARSDYTVARLRNMQRVLPHIERERLAAYLAATSRCHEGYATSDRPWPAARGTPETREIASGLARQLGVGAADLRAGRATLAGSDFGYAKCPPGEMAFPLQGLVVSLRAPSGAWLHAEVHPHEWHIGQTLVSWFQRLAGVFILIALVAVIFMHRLARPLRRLTRGAERFGEGLSVDPIDERGPQDVRRTIAAFNAMQRQVAEAVTRRAQTLAALSHDLRTPLTALRVKAELIEDEAVRSDLIASIRKMESVSTSAIEFLRGESQAEPLRTVDITALVESECADFEDVGAPVRFEPAPPLPCACRPEALARAVRNLIDNAVKHGGGASASVRPGDGWVEIVVSDQGPGIPDDQIANVVEPFVRLSPARETQEGGFGLGLSVVKAVAEGHGGTLVLQAGRPGGLVATIRIPQAAPI